MTVIELVHLFVTAALVGFIWLVALTHYPSFKFVEEENWSSFHRFHSRSISIIAMPLMLVELAIVVYLVYNSASAIHIVFLLLVVIAWLNTFLQAVPLHQKLKVNKDLDLIGRLVQVNWIRTIIWTIKALVLFGFYHFN